MNRFKNLLRKLRALCGEKKEKVHITIWQAPYASLLEHGLYMKMHDWRQPFQDTVPAEYYMVVFDGEIDYPGRLPEDPSARANLILEKAFVLFNTNHPVGYCGRSLSVGDIVHLAGKHYLCATFGFTPVVFSTNNDVATPNSHPCRITLPSGITLCAVPDQDSEYPRIGINMMSDDGKETCLCFVEHNPDKKPGRELCVGAYRDGEDDVVYYDSYFKESEE